MIPLHADIEGVKIEPLRQLLKERSLSGKSMPKVDNLLLLLSSNQMNAQFI